MKEDDEGDEVDRLELEIDGIPFIDHPYIDKDFGKSFELQHHILVILLKALTNHAFL